METRNENLLEIYFFIKARPNFWPKIENRFGNVLALDFPKQSSTVGVLTVLDLKGGHEGVPRHRELVSDGKNQ